MDCNFSLLFIFLLLLNYARSEDLYEILGITKTNDERMIRQAFKQKMLEVHPDNNKGDPGAFKNTEKVLAAYTILRNDAYRQTYDKYGKSKIAHIITHPEYILPLHFYSEMDMHDIPEITTLDKNTFEQNVTRSADTWFIYYYDFACEACHASSHLWVEWAMEQNETANIGVVNCIDDSDLCLAQRVHAIPAIKSYPGRAVCNTVHNKEQMLHCIQHLKSSAVWTTSANIKMMFIIITAMKIFECLENTC